MSRRAKRQRPEPQRPVLHAPPPPPPEMREPDSEREKQTERGVAVIDFYV